MEMRRQKVKQRISWLVLGALILLLWLPGPVVTAADQEAYWTSYRSAPDNNAVKDAKKMQEPVSARSWGVMIGELGEWGTNSKSGMIIIGESLFFATGNEFFRLDKKGEVTGKVTLEGFVGYTARPAYGEGVVVIPLDGGALQAIDPREMKTVWVNQGPGMIELPSDEGEESAFPLQNSSTLHIADGLVYSLTFAQDEAWVSVGGYIQALDARTGETVWQEAEYMSDQGPAGYHMSGSLVRGQWLLTAGERGSLEVRDARTGELKNEALAGSKINAPPVAWEDKIVLTTYDGRLVVFHFDELEGSLSQKRESAFAIKSNSTPAIYQGLAYVGGLLEYGDWETGQPSTGLLALIDLADLTVLNTFETEGELQSSPLVAVGKGKKVFVYFTVNNEVGGLYAYDGQEIKQVFEPDQDAAEQNYTMFSPVMDQEGTVYYANDSGFIFALHDDSPSAFSLSENWPWLLPALVVVFALILVRLFFLSKSKAKKKG